MAITAPRTHTAAGTQRDKKKLRAKIPDKTGIDCKSIYSTNQRQLHNPPLRSLDGITISDGK